MGADQERTESPTPKRIERARLEGDVPRSTLAPIVAAIASSALPILVAPHVARWWIGAFASCAMAVGRAVHTPDAASVLAIAGAVVAAPTPWLALAGVWTSGIAAAVLGARISGTLAWSAGSLRANLGRLSPASGARSLMASGNAANAAFAALAVASIAACAIPAVRFYVVASAANVPAGALGQLLDQVAVTFWWRALVLLALLACADIVLSRRRYVSRLRMTKREVSDERASMEGKPEVKARRRAITARRGRSLRIAALKRATAVITNPTHLAVALRYAPPAIDVPVVVSIGKDLSAALVRAAASAHGVPIIEAPELARALIARVDVDEPIPEELYAAVAVIFARILRARGTLPGADTE